MATRHVGHIEKNIYTKLQPEKMTLGRTRHERSVTYIGTVAEKNKICALNLIWSQVLFVYLLGITAKILHSRDRLTRC
jgi:hypothetical protein